MNDIYKFDVIVVGAGVIGIAIAMTSAKKKNQFYLLKKILVLEKKLAREIVRLFMQVFIILKIP